MQLKQFQTRLDHHLEEDQKAVNTFMDSVNVKKTATQFVIGQPDFWSILIFYDAKKVNQQSPISKPTTQSYENIGLTNEEEDILIALKQWRKDKASALNVPNFMICHNAELIELAQKKPTTLDQLQEIRGFTAKKVTHHGDEIIAIINAFL